MTKNKVENFDKKASRVFEELKSILDKYGKISELTEDQRYVLHQEYATEKSKSFRAITNDNFTFEAQADDTWYNGVSSNINDFSKSYFDAINNTMSKVQDYITKNDLIYYSVGFDDYTHSDLSIDGWVKTSDSDLIKAYTKTYLRDKKQAEEAKKRKIKEKSDKKKTICVNGKKYVLVEEFNAKVCFCDAEYCYDDDCYCECHNH